MNKEETWKDYLAFTILIIFLGAMIVAMMIHSGHETARYYAKVCEDRGYEYNWHATDWAGDMNVFCYERTPTQELSRCFVLKHGYWYKCY